MIAFKLDEENKEVLNTSENHFITKGDFIKKFGDDFRYETLINHENTTDLWKQRFKNLFGKIK